ncbi:DNA-methyltransferase [Chryseobacterium indologenes]|uniref:DNA-methyltransferase n=1 Tax=Chryseobacterium indologenes TaxID=253 RepID=UPI0019310012|nr:site-specific DNA-methyltransferase [Chryseobacterium indologenes]
MIYRDHHQNYKQYHIPKAQLIIADIPYNLGNKAYASNPAWYNDGDNCNGESELAGKEFFMTDKNFKPAEFMHFCSKMLKPEPKEKGTAPAMIIFCAFNQMFDVAELGKKHGLNNYIPLIFRKKFSAQVLKANMKIVGNCEYGLLLYRDKLPKFNNKGKMVMNCIEWVEDEDNNNYPKLHPTQKPVGLLKRLIELFTDVGEVVIDPCAGSGSSLVAAIELNRKAYGFEIDKEFFPKAKSWIEKTIQRKNDIDKYGFAKTEMDEEGANLFTEII